MRRRDFLKASAAAGAGATLLDGCSGPPEEYIVQRVRQTSALPSEPVWVPGVCRQCSAGCGILVRVIDGDAKKIEGNEAHPVNRGGVCALGHSVLQELYNPDRLLQAQRSTGARGEGAFEAVAWDEAISTFAGVVGATAPERIAILAGDRAGFTGALWRRFADALGAPPPAFASRPEAAVEREAARIALGTEDFPWFDLANADCALSIGAPLLDRWRSAAHYTRAVAAMRRARPTRRGRLIQAEARMSLTAANADLWVPVRPGTEGVFARAVAGLLLEDPRIDAAAARRYRVLFPDAPPAVEEAARVCDVAEEKIRQTAEELAAAEAPVVVAGGSAAAHTNGLFNVVAALGLNVLLDDLGRPGGVYAPVAFGLERAIEPPDAGETPLAELAARLRGESGPPVELLIVSEADPLHALPAAWGLEAALANVGTVVVLSSFRDDTALHADLVLPLATELERFEAYEPATSVGAAALGLSEPIVEPLGDGRHPADVILQVAAAAGEPLSARLPWESFEDLVAERVGQEQSRLPGGEGASASAYLDDAIEAGGIFGDAPGEAPPGPSGAAPAAAEARFEGTEGEYPLHLLPFESVAGADGRGLNRPWLQEHPDPLSTVMWNSWVELAPTTAAELGVHDGDRVRIESASAAVEALAVIDPAVRPGVVCVPAGHGYRDNGRYAQGRGANVAHVLGAALVDGTGAPAWAATRVRITRIGEGNLVRFGRSWASRGADEMIPVGWAPQDTSRPSRRREASV